MPDVDLAMVVSDTEILFRDAQSVLILGFGFMISHRLWQKLLRDEKRFLLQLSKSIVVRARELH